MRVRDSRVGGTCHQHVHRSCGGCDDALDILQSRGHRHVKAVGSRGVEGTDAAKCLLDVVVPVHDTVGAGDCFLAGMMVALLERPAVQAAANADALKLDAEDMDHILCHAIASASLCVQEVGCVPPNLEKVRARMKLAKAAFKAL